MSVLNDNELTWTVFPDSAILCLRAPDGTLIDSEGFEFPAHGGDAPRAWYRCAMAALTMRNKEAMALVPPRQQMGAYAFL